MCGASEWSRPQDCDRVAVHWMRCDKCGYETLEEYVLALPVLPEDEYERHAIYVVWRSRRPTMEELFALRRLVPRYADAPPQALRASLAEGELLLGKFEAADARDLVARGSALGLHLEVR